MQPHPFPPQQSQEQEDDDGRLRIHVGNIPFTWTVEDLRGQFIVFGPVIDTEIVSNERGSKGFGFLTFLNRWDGEKAILIKNGTIADGRKIQVSLAVKKELKTRRILGAIGNHQQFHQNKNNDQSLGGTTTTAASSLLSSIWTPSSSLLYSPAAVQPPQQQQQQLNPFAMPYQFQQQQSQYNYRCTTNSLRNLRVPFVKLQCPRCSHCIDSSLQ